MVRYQNIKYIHRGFVLLLFKLSFSPRLNIQEAVGHNMENVGRLYRQEGMF